MFLKDLLFPKFCLDCGYLGVYICPKCRQKLRYVENDTCSYCQRPSFFGLTHPGCQKLHSLDGVVSIFYYNDFLKKIIKSIKYRLATEVWSDFCRIIKPEGLSKISFYKKLADKFFLQPIPLHPSRLKSRGFNQARIIAYYFQGYLSYPLVDWLKRIRPTAAQAQLTKGRMRYRNVNQAFQVNDTAAKGQKIILIDDVMTTGATLKAAASALKKAGAARVYALVIAKG